MSGELPGDPLREENPSSLSGVQGNAAPTREMERRFSPAAAYAMGAAALLLVVAWSFTGVFQGSGLLDGGLGQRLARGVTVARQFWPPDDTVRAQLQVSMIETVQMAVVGTLLGALFAAPLSFFAARTTSLSRVLSSIIKTVMNITRATPVIVYAIILTAIVGLGKATGAIALAVGTFVMLTKLYAEALESISSGPVEAVRAAGGNTIQTFIFGMLPQVFPNYVATTLYAFELNLQASFILGFVGAGGIGYDLQNYLREFAFTRVSMVLLIIIVVVNVVDFVSYRIRRAIS